MSKLVECLTCGKKVAERANACPHCGDTQFRKDIDKNNPVLIIIAIIAIIGGLTMFISDLLDWIG